mgnify:CR=1 FL=1
MDMQVDDSGELIFSDSYSPYWVLNTSGATVQSKKTKYGFNSFYVNKPGKYVGDIMYLPERLYSLGRTISVISFLIMVTYILFYNNRHILPNR